MTARFECMELAIEHMRDGRHRMPVSRVRMGESVTNAIES
jgi:hypothetical protein